MVAGGGAVEAEGQRHADRGGAEVADLPDEARVLQLLRRHTRLPEALQGRGVGLARRDRGVPGGGPLGEPLEARQGLLRRRPVGVEEHLEAVAGLGLGAEAPDVVDLTPRPGGRAEAREAPRGAHQEGARRTGREGVADAVLVADQVVGGHDQRRGVALTGEGAGDLEGVEQRPRVTGDVDRQDAVEAEGAREGGRELAQPEGRRLADRDHGPRRLRPGERRDGGLVGHREGVLVERRGAQRLGARATRTAEEGLDLLERGPVTGQVRPVPEDLRHRYRLIVMPAASRSNVSAVTPSSRSFTFCTRSVGVLGSSGTKRM